MSSDGIRERQLADLGWRDATVDNDGRTVTVTMTVRDFDVLMECCDVNAWNHGYERGLAEGKGRNRGKQKKAAKA